MTICALLLLCSLLAPVDFTEGHVDHQVLDDSQSPSHVNAFNTSYTDDLKITELQLDFSTAFPGWVSSDFQIIDFSQSVDGSYLIMIYCKGYAGMMWNGKGFRMDDPILLHADVNGTFINSVVLSHQYKINNGAWNTVDFNWQLVGPTSLIDPPDMNEDIIIAGSLGEREANVPYTASVSYRIENFITVSGRPQQIFVMSLNRTNFNMTNSILTPSSRSANYDHCEFAVSEDSFTNSSGFSIGVAFEHTAVSWGGTCGVQIGGQSYSLGYQNTNEKRTSFVMTYDFNLSLQSHIEVDGNHEDNTLPYFSQNGGMAWSEMTSTSGTGLREMKVRSPTASSWTPADVSNCSTTAQGNGLYDIPMHGSISDRMLLACTSTTTGTNGTEIYLGTISTTDGTSLSGYFVGACNGNCDPQHLVHPTSTIALLWISVRNGGSYVSPNGITYYSDVTISVNMTTGTVMQANPLFQSKFMEGVGNDDDRFILDVSEFGRPVADGRGSFIFFQWNSGQARELTIVEIDSDLDSYPDRTDVFPYEPSQHLDADGDGFGDNPLGFGGDDCTNQAGNSTIDLLGCPDNDGDGYSNQGDLFQNDATQISDFDADGFGDNLTGTFGDACPSIYGESTRDRYGCPDADFDGWSDDNDTFPNESSQWADTDADGYGDQLIGFEGDACPATSGNSTEDQYGCPDADGDGWSDDEDDMPSNPSQWKDRDGDGYGDNADGPEADVFPSDGTQWNDTDGDVHGDNPYGSEGDWFPNDPSRWADSDRDGVTDEEDAFPNDATQWNDTDGDGYGDEETGNRGDAFPNDVDEWDDSDSDGVGDNEDAFPFDPSQQTDGDGDGFGDNDRGSGADRFPDDPSQWSDIDGDGYGDNQTGNDADAFIANPTQWTDADGDGFGDNSFGRNADAFPNDATQWEDQDGDGFGDNLSGNDPDPYLFDFDNDGYNDSIDLLPKLASPGDLDNDGCMDEEDVFPADFRECLDFDEDGVGDNADPDDDNDGWTDTDEDRQLTDAFDASDYPVDVFQIIIPGTSIGLDGWDLIGIFGGVPLFAWILFGFITRNSRAGRFEMQLNAARSKGELEEIAIRSEYALMIRLIGAHQGIRLERLRAELDDALDAEGIPVSEDMTGIVEQEMGEMDEPVDLSEGMDAAPPLDAVGIVGQDGYEWLEQGGATWYRPTDGDLDWARWMN